ncbi:MAG: TldD/PmbA family protein [Nitrospirae bacterium]|nr:TldD/PmbA family protein [Nitrospirota bacterium]
MLDHELLFRVLKRTLSKGGDFADIFGERTHSTSIQLEDNRVEKILSGVDAGTGVRVIFGQKSAYAYSNDFSEAGILELADAAGKAVRMSAAGFTIDLKKKVPSVDFAIKLLPENVPMDRKIHLIESANKAARGVDSRVKQVSVIYRDSVQKVQIATSDGNIAEDERIYTTAVIQVVAAEGDIIQTGYEPVGGFIGFELFDENPLDEIAIKTAKRAVAMLRAKKAPGGRMPVVISARAGGTMIHEAIGHGLEADLAQQGLSVYSNKIGSQVASPLITVIDDSTLPNKRGSFRFDDEGTSSQRTILVEKGILKGYMYDILTAMKDGVASTGNGRRESYKHRPIPRMTNTFIAQGEESPEAVIKSVEKGLFVKKMGGGQVNTVTGEFVFEVSDGYLIEKGKVGEPLRGATLCGNGPEILRAIDMVANDLGFSIGTCGKDAQGVPVSDAMPTIRIPDMVVGGEVYK